VLILLLILLVAAVSLTVILWAGTFFFQGYLYTEPSPGIFWQAPAAAALLTLGYTIWCFAIALNPNATGQNLPIDTIFRFSPKEEMPELQGRPAKKIWAIKLDHNKTGDNKDGEVVEYVGKTGIRPPFQYREAKEIKPHPWHKQDVIAIEIEIEKPDRTKLRFDLTPTTESDYRQFESQDGWVIREYEEGPTGVPIRFRFGRLLLNLFFNVCHFVGWFLGLWVLLRFQWTHALGLAVVLWLIFTLTMLPMMLGYAGSVAADRQPAPRGAKLGIVGVEISDCRF
jgi:hypothetical protein